MEEREHTPDKPLMDCCHCCVVQVLFVDSRVISSTSDLSRGPLAAAGADMHSAVNLTGHLDLAVCIGAAPIVFPL